MNNWELRNRLFGRVTQRLNELGIGIPEELEHCPELNPDVIVIPDDHSLLFEIRTPLATGLMAQICGIPSGAVALEDQIRVHPSRSRQIVSSLRAAGAAVSGEI